MNKFAVMMIEMVGSSLPKVGQFGEFLKLLSAHGMTDPPQNAQFNDGLNMVHLNTNMCADCLKSLLAKEGFRVTVGQSEEDAEECQDDCPNHQLVPAE